MDKLKEAIIRNVFGVLLYRLSEFSSEIPLHVKNQNQQKKKTHKPRNNQNQNTEILHR